MKGYVEDRGVLSRMAYDEQTGSFVAKKVPHPFVPAEDAVAPATADVTPLTPKARTQASAAAMPRQARRKSAGLR